ncbi:hypothetical protein AOL_s00006g389 [Orbilia oligospora ATCC 24927]|uniref:Mid2 domain-containing protein n=1 Tax=Arthrobotrys oligospora (strain ATCC 24927 / CBS 115.81 / DSM 1491) TaxID=756982 RepID=G1X0I8_ARTOA|nr:hypothetical protein AOL_s00006g389 [Orbilia oligospora ATCC 24927]EGX53523.1 hypothetical protein AOL_s00006g389 [Orbilia oligospora ATCC 24927]
MHSSQPFSIPLAIIALLTALRPTLTLSQSTTTKSATLKLTTVAPYPTTWTVSANCFSEVSARDDNQETIYNMGCGAQVRKSCCPPGWSPGVVFGDITSTVGGSKGLCPSGYIDRPEWGGPTEGPILTRAGSVERTVVCCPRLSDPYFVSTYARPFFLAVEAVVTATSSPPETTETTSNRPTTSGLGTTAGGSIPTETGGGGNGDDVDQGDNNGQGGKSGLSSGAIAGIVIGVIAPIAIGIIAFIFWRRKRSFGMGMMDRGIDPPVPPPPTQTSGNKFIPFDDSRSSSYGKVENGAYRYKLPAGSETILSSNAMGMRSGENEERRIAVFENAEKLPEPSENEAVYAQQNYKFGGPARAR